MSIEIMARVWGVPNLKPAEMLVLLCYADHAQDGGGGAFPSVARVAQRCGMKTKNVRTIIHRLRRRGLLTVEEPAKRYRPTTYRVSVDLPPDRSAGNIETSRAAGVLEPVDLPCGGSAENGRPPARQPSDLPRDSPQTSRAAGVRPPAPQEPIHQDPSGTIREPSTALPRGPLVFEKPLEGNPLGWSVPGCDHDPHCQTGTEHVNQHLADLALESRRKASA
jgi:hypothetical protein